LTDKGKGKGKGPDLMDKNEREKEMDDFFAQFVNVHDEFDKISENLSNSERGGPAENAPTSSEEGSTPLSRETRVFRSRRFQENDTQTREEPLESQETTLFPRGIGGSISSFKSKFKSRFFIDRAGENPQMKMKKNGKSRTKRYRLNTKRLLKTLALFIALIGAIALIFISSIVFSSPSIEPDNIYGLLSESSVLYDDKGQPIESVFEAEGKRTNMEYVDMPTNLINAFVALEDKTFWNHNGFNVIRIFGAIRDSFTSGQISGTSTITQQLARNVYLAETKSERSMNRKIREAYYTVQLERNLSKEQIIEAYLNTIFLGYNSYGVQAASRAYFGKDVGELELFECAALAAIPQMPDRHALIKTLNSDSITEETEGILYKGSQYTYVVSDVSKDRRELCLRLMLEQEKISREEYDLAVSETIAAHLNPGLDEKDELSSYFTDYVINQVILDLRDEFKVEYSDARQMLYTNGLSVYTTMNSDMQLIIETEFSNSANFPKVANLRKDGKGNVIGNNGQILLHDYSTYFDENQFFVLSPEEYQRNGDGSVTILKGKRLNIYNTTVKGETDYSLEFKPLYLTEDSVFYSINGGYVNIPPSYKTRDGEGNLVISQEFFTDFPEFFSFDNRGMSFGPASYSLNQRVIQPQSAMVITEYKTGQIKAMVGGRITKGRMLFNRATSPHQPGSAIKPMSVYSAALQQGYEAQAAGTTQVFVTYDNYGNEIPNYYGDYWTAASVIDDAPLKTGDKIWPKNWYNSYRGLMSARTAVEQSVNVAAVKVVSQVGFDYSADILEKMGVSTVERENLQVNDLNPAALGLGGMTHGISPLEMAGGYGTIANYGKYVEPVCYTHVTNKRGETILDRLPKTVQVLDEGVAWIMSDILRSVVTNGLGSSASIPSQPVAGKTGTTTDNFDAWFVGYTPTYASSLWIGNDASIELSQGSVAAARLWSKIMKQCLQDTPRETFGPAPGNVVSATVDAYSGGLPTSGPTRSEYFVKGTVPTQTISVYSRVAVCTETGYLATPWCPSVTYKSGTDRGYSVEDANAASTEVPRYYCPYHNHDITAYPVDPSGNTRYDFEAIVTEDPEVPETPPETITPPAINDETPPAEGEPGTTPPTSPGTTPPGQTKPGEDEEVPGWLL
jgi:penicillin-binding protein 1A